MTEKKLPIEELPALLRGRRIYIWGAGAVGQTCLSLLKRLGLSPAAFLDQKAALWPGGLLGRPVFEPEEILAAARPGPGAGQGGGPHSGHPASGQKAGAAIRSVPGRGPAYEPPSGGEEIFILTASRLHGREMARRLREAGLVKGRDYLSFFAVDRNRPFGISVSSRCNLRCPSCAPAYAPPRQPDLMSPEDFVRVLDKTVREFSEVSIIHLFNWGEPLMHPQIIELIEEAARRDLATCLSSNLNLPVDFDRLVQSGLSRLIVSASGFEETYERTHLGGRWPVLMENLGRLARARDRHPSPLTIEFTYHLYRYQRQAEDFRRIRALARDLDFHLAPTFAYIAPYEAMVRAARGQAPAPCHQRIRELLYVSPEDSLAALAEHRDLPCDLHKTVVIDSDRSVRRCFLWHEAEGNQTAPDFLAVSRAEIEERAEAGGLCRLCRSLGLQSFFYRGVLDERAGYATLGPEYQPFLGDFQADE